MLPKIEEITQDDSVFIDEILRDNIVFDSGTKQIEKFLAACRYICHKQKIALKIPTITTEIITLDDYLFKIAKTSNFRVRKIELDREWWTKDSGFMLAYYKKKTPVVLVPGKNGYEAMIDLKKKISIKIDATNHKQISEEVFAFYRPFPKGKLNLRGIFKFAFATAFNDVRTIVVAQIAMAMLALIIPIATGYILDTIVPNADKLSLGQMAIALLINFVVMAIFNAAELISLIRARYSAEVNLEAAIWDRMFKLPMNFFKNYNAGDVAFRVNGIQRIQNTLSDTIIITITSGFVSVVTLLLMLYYDAVLTLFVVLFVFLIAVIALIFDFIRLHYERQAFKQRTEQSSLMQQVITGINKLRTANAERRVFNLWRGIFISKTKAEFKGDYTLIRSQSIFAAISVITTLVIYGLVVYRGTNLSFGAFISFNAAFMQFFVAFLSMTNLVTRMIEIVPDYENIKPILLSTLEREEQGTDPGILSGDIKVKNIVFRYQKDTLPLFKDLSFTVKPGEFVALVGPSGAGKSTIFNLLLGLTQSEAGEIYYNGMNLKTLDLIALRDQVGVVLQQTKLIPGSIYENIACNSQVKREDVWKIVDQVGLADFIKELPMGMDTLINEANATISGGQAQRILLARALAKQVRILFLDEATSALDNITQNIVQEYLGALNITRIIAAHRLSTIINADCIYVIDNGAIVQKGTYEQLMQEEGIFKILASRQTI